MYDLAVLFLYFLVIIAIGVLASKGTSTIDSFYLAKNKIHWSLLLISLIATETSSLTFLSLPTLGYKSSFSFLSLALGFILGRIFTAIYLVPMYMQGRYVSLYSFVGNVLGKPMERSVSFTFLVARVIGDGIRLFATSIPFVLILQTRIPVTVDTLYINIFVLFVISFVTILYTVSGGFTAVVWTDALQFLIYIASAGIAIYFLLVGQPQIKPEWFYPTEVLDFKSPYFIAYGLIGGFFLTIGSHGTDQMMVQRILATKKEADGKKVLILSGIIVFFQFALFLTIGILLKNLYITETKIGDKVFSEFIISKIPAPFLGLILAGLLASAMSTLSSTINSLSLTINVNFQFGKNVSPKKLSIFWGLILFFATVIPFLLGENSRKPLIEIALTVSGYIWGPTLGIFLLYLVSQHSKSKFLSKNLAFSSYWISLVLLIAIEQSYKFPFTLLVPIGLLCFSGVYYLFFLFKKISGR